MGVIIITGCLVGIFDGDPTGDEDGRAVTGDLVGPLVGFFKSLLCSLGKFVGTAATSVGDIVSGDFVGLFRLLVGAFVGNLDSGILVRTVVGNDVGSRVGLVTLGPLTEGACIGASVNLSA